MDGEPSNTEMTTAEYMVSLAVQAGSNGGCDAAAVFTRFRAILDDYREQSELLDPILEQLVAPLAAVLQAAAAHEGAATQATARDLSGLFGVSRLLWMLATTRGVKTVSRFLPNAAADLEPVLALLEQLHTGQGKCLSGVAVDAVEAAEKGAWEARCILLLWLSILVLVPFDLATIDSRESGGRRSLAQRLTNLCRSCLESPGPEREVAALVLGRLLTRRDAGELLTDFLAWAPKALKDSSQQAAFLLPADVLPVSILSGVVATLAEVLKSGQTVQAACLAREQCGFVLSVSTLPAVTASSLVRRLLVKLMTRMALALLPLAPATWQRTTRIAALHATLSKPPGSSEYAAQNASGIGTGTAAGSSQSLDSSPQSAAELSLTGHGAALGQPHKAGDNKDKSAVVTMSDAVEDITGELLQALRDSDTVVRWSAARGVGCVTGRLPAAAGAEVLESILQDLDAADTVDEATRHGCCLAVAELTRRGLLPPAQLQEVVPHVVAALHYDVQQGAHSLGACVRDAAAYVCWAISRSYAPDEVAPVMQQLAPALLTAAVLDREVACRRAAAAAFQEAVGRLGSFPDGIALLTAANYFSLSSRSQAYMQVAPQIAAFAAYRQPLADVLLRVKLCHWDCAVRILAAEATAQLVPLDPGFWARTAVPELLAAALDSNLEVRHGAMLGLAAILPAHAANGANPVSLGVTLENQEQRQLAGLVADVERLRLLRGRGGELMRAALCRFVEGLAWAQLPLDGVQAAELLEFLDQQLAHPSDAVHDAAAPALHAFTRAYWTNEQAPAPAQSDAGINDQRSFLIRLVQRLAAPQATSEARRGAATALGALPGVTLQTAAHDVLTALAAAATLQDNTSADDAAAGVEARAAAVRALAAVVVEGFGKRGASGRHPAHMSVSTGAADCSSIAQLLGDVVCGALLTAMEDYTTDNSWVREAAMAGLTAVLPILASVAPDAASSCVASATAAIAKQAVERIARMRQAAGGYLHALLEHQPVLRGIPQHAALSAVLADLGPDGCANLKALPAFATLLPEPRLRPALLQGLAMGLGGLDAQLTAACATALSSTLTRTSAAEPRVGILSESGSGNLSATSSGPQVQVQQEAAAERMLDTWHQQPVQTPQGGDGSSSSSSGSVTASNSLLRAVVGDLPLLWQQTERSSRMALPLLRLVLLLLTECGAGRQWRPAPPAGHASPPKAGDCQPLQDLVELVKACGRACGDVARLCAVGEALCRLAGCGAPVRDSALSGVLTLLASRLPRVRRHVAEHLYIETLAAWQDVGSGTIRSPETLHVLASCCWDGDLTTAKAARQQLYPLLGITPPVRGKTTRMQQPHRKAFVPHEGSYQQLVDTAARH